jgi:hypothetical protein
LLTGPVPLRGPSLPRPIRRGLDRLMVYHQYIDRRSIGSPFSQSRPTDLLSLPAVQRVGPALHIRSTELSHPTTTVDLSLPGPSSAKAAPPAVGTASAICIKWNLGRCEGTPRPKTYAVSAVARTSCRPTLTSALVRRVIRPRAATCRPRPVLAALWEEPRRLEDRPRARLYSNLPAHNNLAAAGPTSTSTIPSA